MSNDIKKIVVAGAGTMGTSISFVFAMYGFNVYLYNHKQEKLLKSRENIQNIESVMLENLILKESDIDVINNQIQFSSDIDCFTDADFVLESIIEDIEIKRSFLSEISSIAHKDTIIASNTSGLSLTTIANKVLYPERFCGMHWLNPPHICPLIEVVCTSKTSIDTMEKVCSIAEDVHHYPVLLKKEVPGFLVNRFQFAILREAMGLVEDGVASIEDIDKVFKYGLGMRYACLGPFEIADHGGLDVFDSIASYLFKDLYNSQDENQLLKDHVNKDEFGVKSQRGFYDYSNGKNIESIKERDKMYLKVSKCLFYDNMGDIHENSSRV